MIEKMEDDSVGEVKGGSGRNNRSMIQSFNHSIIQSFNSPISHSLNDSIAKSLNLGCGKTPVAGRRGDRSTG